MKKKKPTKSDKVYVFEVVLGLRSPKMDEGKVNQGILKEKKAPWREIAILGSHNLYNFAEAINDAFGFMFDHCFGFYSNWKDGERYTKSEEMYELFTDLGEEPTPNAKPVKRSKIAQVFKEVGKKMLFYFDYGDGWRFIVELKEIKEPDFKISYPNLLDKFGPNPEQYPPLEE